MTAERERPLVSLPTHENTGDSGLVIPGTKKTVKERLETDHNGDIELYYDAENGLIHAEWTLNEGITPTQFLADAQDFRDSISDLPQVPYARGRRVGLSYTTGAKHEGYSIHGDSPTVIDADHFEEPKEWKKPEVAEEVKDPDSREYPEDKEHPAHVTKAQFNYRELIAIWEEGYKKGVKRPLGKGTLIFHLDLPDEVTKFISDRATSLNADAVREKLAEFGALAQERQREIAAEMAQAS